MSDLFFSPRYERTREYVPKLPERCADCVFYVKVISATGRCHRHAPVYTSGGTFEYPRVCETEWYGDGILRDEKDE